MKKSVLPAALLAILIPAASGAVAWAADCGDAAGGAGIRVPCACGDTVVTNTTLKASDPVVTTGCAGVGLDIGADNVTLNCNGRQITGDLTEAGLQLVGRTGVTVRMCKIADFDRGIWLVESSGNALLSNTITGGSFGILLEADSDDNLIRSNRLVAPAGDGINLQFASRNAILTNDLDGDILSGDGIDLDGVASDNTVKGNRVTGFGGSGIEVDAGGGNLIIENNSSANGVGIRVNTFEPNTIARNTTDRNEADGIDACCEGHTIGRNHARENGFNGITVNGDGHRITRNSTDANLGAGIGLDGDDNIVDQNRGRANSVNGLETSSGTGNTITGNVFDDNVENGFFIRADDGLIDGNRGRNNGLVGLDVSGAGNTVSNNTFFKNTDWDICVVEGNIDGGGNRGDSVTFACP